MRKKASKGFKRTFVFYALGVILTVLTHLLRGFRSPEVPPTSLFILILFISIGFVWLCADIILIYFKRSPTKEKADLLVHIIGLLVFGILITLIQFWGIGARGIYEP